VPALRVKQIVARQSAARGAAAIEETAVPLQTTMELIGRARAGGYAVGYFESWNLESLQGVIDAAEETRSPALIGFNGEFLSHAGRRAAERLDWYAALGRAAAQSARVPCALIFNECADDAWVRAAVDAGFSQVMPDDPDAAPRAFERRVAALARYAHDKGAAIEAEVGRLTTGARGVLQDGAQVLTDPGEAARFVADTGIDILAVSIGNVHVLLDGREPLDLERLAALRARVDTPFDLHGGSGIPAECIREAVRLGVAKVCYGTYVKQRYLEALRRGLAMDESNPHKRLGYGGDEDLLTAGRLAVKAAVLERIGDLGCCGRA
jgi:ketose-bisphosphate aldolase